MLHTQQALKKALDQQSPVYYFYSEDEFLLRQQAGKVLAMLAGEDSETTVLEGPNPDIGEIVMAAGTISFFSSRRLVELPLLQPTGYSDKDLDALCDVLASAENAVFVITSLLPEPKKHPKRAKKLIAHCESIGYAAELARPNARQLKTMMQQRAEEQGAQLPEDSAAILLDRCGQDMFLLQNEVDKLSALSGYREITPAMVADLGTQNLEADVFDMVRLITAKNSTKACQKLHDLLRLQNEPIAITAAMIGSYIDLYRVKCGAEAHKPYSAVHKDFGYRGSDYRLKKSGETASHYTKNQLAHCLSILEELDLALKGCPLDKEVLMESALVQLAMAGVER